MSNAMKTLTFIISLIAYFIYLSISSAIINALLASGNIGLAVIAVYISSALGIFTVLYTQAGIKYWYASRALKDATVHVTLPLGKYRVTDRLLVYMLPALAVIVPFVQTRSLSAIKLDALLFVAVVIFIIEVLFSINGKTTKAYLTNKGLVIRGIDLRLEIPFPSNYHNPTGHYPFERILYFVDLNDKVIIEQSHDLGVITLTGDSETLKQVKGVLLANKVRQKKF